MDLGNLKHAEGARKKKKRIGRGQGSGWGKTAGRGNKGQKSRSGAKSRPWFEGGQMPLQRRVPKRGFTNLFRKKYQIVNLQDLDKLKEKTVTPEVLYKARLIRKRSSMFKVLGQGEVKKAMEIQAHAFSKSALEKIEAAGGKATVL
jgi:large subunit ribosomal protein L15